MGIISNLFSQRLQAEQCIYTIPFWRLLLGLSTFTIGCESKKEKKELQRDYGFLLLGAGRCPRAVHIYLGPVVETR